jgi:ABC-type phosphate transport system substrate-binding protein
MTRRLHLWITAALTIAATALTVAATALTVGLTTSASPPTPAAATPTAGLATSAIPLIQIDSDEERTRGDWDAVNLAPTNVHLMGLAVIPVD